MVNLRRGGVRNEWELARRGGGGATTTIVAQNGAVARGGEEVRDNDTGFNYVRLLT